jgi:hypothetical protein
VWIVVGIGIGIGIADLVVLGTVWLWSGSVGGMRGQNGKGKFVCEKRLWMGHKSFVDVGGELYGIETW